MRRAVFLDRDGVLSRSLVIDGKPHAPGKVAEFEIYPEARGALDKLRAAGFLLCVVTNQPNVSRGLHDPREIDEMNRLLGEALPLDEIFVCTHSDEDACTCRKPKPGFLLQAAEKYGLDLKQSFMVGDRWRDVECGQNAGCATVWIDRGWTEKQPSGHTHRALSLSEAVEWILGVKD